MTEGAGVGEGVREDGGRGVNNEIMEALVETIVGAVDGELVSEEEDLGKFGAAPDHAPNAVVVHWYPPNGSLEQGARFTLTINR